MRSPGGKYLIVGLAVVFIFCIALVAFGCGNELAPAGSAILLAEAPTTSSLAPSTTVDPTTTSIATTTTVAPTTTTERATTTTAKPTTTTEKQTTTTHKATTTTVATNDGGGITVYITDTGEKYHRGSCRYLSHSKHAISLEDAIAQGYGACKVCKPPQ